MFFGMHSAQALIFVWGLCQVQGAFDYEFNVISTGADYTLAVKTDGTAFSWGFPFSERPKVYVPAGYLWTYVRAGISHSCSITNGSQTLCWGRQREGQCDVPAGYSFQQLSLGEAHTCGITDTADLLCWGSPIDDTLGVPAGNTWSQVDAGTVSTCAVNTTGSILCWGKQGYDRKAVPYLDNSDVVWQEVACGDRHCCGLLEESAVQALSRRQEDNVVCWGDDANQQLQVPGKEQGRTGTQETFSSISAGNFHTCGLTLGMNVWCWGRVTQYGLNFQTPGNATALASGGTHACVLDVNKKAICWGGNQVGQATVPVDGATVPPLIMEFANDPFDIMEEDPLVRLTPFIDGYTEPKRTFQNIMMDILFPEFALTDTPTLTFERIDGTEDPYSPHIIKFPDSWNAPIINQIQISAFDLTLWNDIRLGASPAIRNITSTFVNGTTEHKLVDGGAYSVKLEYQDYFSHPVATHWIQRYEVTYDLETLAPTVWSPSPGLVKQAITVGYYLPEDMNPDEVWITLTFTGPSAGQQVQDSNSPYQVQLAKAVTYKGNHSFLLVLGDLYNLLDGQSSPYVQQVLTAGGVAAAGISLVSGGNYDLSLRVNDTFFNTAKMVQVSGLDFIWDTATEPVQQSLPTGVLTDPIVIQYTITEPVATGSLRFTLTWMRNTNQSATEQADVQSPHTWLVIPSKEADVTSGTASNILRLSASNLFRDPDDEALPHPHIRQFESKGTPVYSTLEPYSEYELTISYKDQFGNPRSFLNTTLPTNFTPPAAPGAPSLRSRTTTSLELAWTRGETGGLRITKYDLQLFGAPDPPLWWNGTTAEAALYAGNMGGAVLLQEQEVVGQESNQTTFRDLNSSQHYLLRVRASSKAGDSPWSPWSMLRVLSSCGDGAPHDGEACDDGNKLDGDGCSSSCLVERGWTCEAQPAGLYADGWGRGPSRCSASGMDGLRVGSEECDDCNAQAGDGCDNGKVEPGHICTYQGRLGIETGCPGILAADTNNYLTFTADDCRIPCGDGIRHIVAGEECDDGNIINGDGCTSDCRIETGYTCPTVGWPQILLTPCRPICGDGLRLGDEECDDNNNMAGDGCGADCKVEIGWFCIRTNDAEVCLNTCLNGVIDPGEECDDANTFSDDGCANCIIEPGWTCEAIANRQTDTSSGSFCTPVCGDGFRITSGPMAEQCDDGNNLAGDGCDPSCVIEPGWICVSQASEVNTTALRCEPVCGDGLLVVGEACDDGNQNSGDGCSQSCKPESGFVCLPEDLLTKSEVATGPPFAAQNRTVCTPICGDGLVLLTFGESCDDSNRIPGDGCDENCNVEPGYTCGSTGSLSASVCTPICGDGLLRSPETCDDGNTGKGDGCNEQCQLEQGYQCWPPGVPCRFLCGDYLRLEGEACDDGNLQLEDGCDSSCQVEDGWSCSSFVLGATNATSVCSPICGDGKIKGSEACDDGNLAGGDGCDENCSVEAGWICCDPPSGTTGSICSLGADQNSCAKVCGNGQRDPGEACDDGNLNATDGCSPRCEVEAGFACMPMVQQRSGRTTPDYCEAICGDGLLVVGEECDDGNQVSGDGCGPTCKIEQSGTSCPPLSDLKGAVCRPTCGDGVRGPREECDDGNSFSGDGCSQDCIVERGFTCSGGGMRSRDTCSPICGDGLRVDRAFSATIAANKLEGCDTGPIPSRGCDAATCQVRPGWTCARQAGPSAEVCTPVCGDGILITPMEECDDNNVLPGDGCSPDCKVEALYECSYISFFFRSVCQIQCGDGRRHPTEACDDGNKWDQDGCSSNCQIEAGFECLGGTAAFPSECKPICGDGYEVDGEGCDDGNLVPWDGCNQFCQVEEGYHCTRAPSPGGQGVASTCTKSCGDGVQNFDEECDDAATGNSLWCSKCRKLPETVCGDFRRSDSEECDDGNTVSGDGCSSSCTLEAGWTCAKGPTHLDPGTAPGDMCTSICGDGLVVAGEACDDGNYRGDDGCTGDCRVEPLYGCFLPAAAELLQVPDSERTSNGPQASICVRTTPPRLLGARFDESFATLELQFDSKVAPVPGEDYSGGVALAAPAFSCNAIFDPTTVRLIGQGPRCWWKSRQLAAVALGSDAGLVPGSAVVLQAGVLRRYVFSSDTAPRQELRADVPGGLLAPVLWPKPVIWGPQLVPSCADSITLNSDNSQGLAGRMALPSRWYMVGAFNITNGTWDPDELQRIQTGLVVNAQESQVIFPRQGALLSLVDLEYDRSLRVNYLYRICLMQENVLGLTGVACHHLEVEELPVPVVEPLVPPGPYSLPRYGRWLNLEMRAVVPQGCVLGDAPLGTSFRAGQAPEPTHGLTLEEPLRLLAAAWSYDASLRTTYAQQAPAVTLVSDALPLGQEVTGNRSADSRLSVEPGTFAGYVNVHGVACINASKNLTENETSSGILPVGEVCGYYSFLINVQDLPAETLASVSSSRRASVIGDQLLAAAAASADLRLVGLAPSPGAAPEGPPLQADEGKTPTALRLEVLQDPQGNLRRAELLQFGWLGAVEPENSTTILGAIPLPATSGDGTFTQAELEAGLASLTPVVTWTVQADTRTGTQVASEPLSSSVGGVFLRLPPQQLSPGSQVQVAAQLDLLPPNAGISCTAPLRSLTQKATLTVGLPPAAGYVLVDRAQVVAPVRLESFVLESMRWSSQVLPLQYRIEAEFSTGERILLNDWSYDPKLSVVLLPRAENVLVRGQVRDGRGTFSATAPVSIALSSKTGAEDLRILTEFRQGTMSQAVYSTRRTSQTLIALESDAANMDVALQLQLWQDVAFATLSGSYNGTFTNCTQDCGPQGRCPTSLENKSQGCICNNGWNGTLCEIQSFEVESQELITRKVLDALKKLFATNLEVLGITSRKGALGRIFKLLCQVGADCRRLPVDLMASMAAFAAGLQILVPKAALRDANAEIADLISKLYGCLPQAPALPMATIPAPATVLLTSLGSSQICRLVGSASTKLCYDLASSDVWLSCNISTSQGAGSAVVEHHCRADLSLGLSEPYPCPCPVPADAFLGYGRSGEEPPLANTLSARNEKDILWRELLKLFWNSTAYSVNLSPPGPTVAAALWLQELGAPDNEVTAALAKAQQIQLLQQGILLILKQMAQLLADALLVAAVPGQAPSEVTSLPVVAHWGVPNVVPLDDVSGESRNGTAVLSVDTAGTTVEVEFESSFQLPSAPQLPSILPVKVPMGALHWNYAGRGLFSQMDPSVMIHSDVVQLRLLESDRFNLTKLRYRFMVADKSEGSCSAQRPTEDLLQLCCNASNATTRPGTFASLSCPTSAASSSVQARRAMVEIPRSLASTETPATEAASVVEIVGQQAPFEQGLESLLDNATFWTPSGQTVLLAGTHIRLRGGDLKVTRVCDSGGNAASRLMLKAGQLQGPEDSYYADAWCRTVFARARAKQSSARSWETFPDLLLEAAEEVIADPSVVPTSTTRTMTSSTITMSTSTSSTRSSVSTTTSTITTSATDTSSTFVTTTATTTTLTGSSSSTSTVTLTYTSTSSRSTTSSQSITRSATSSTTTVGSTTASTSVSSTTPPWCTRSDSDQAQTDVWCASGVDSEIALPVYADVELSDPGGVLFVDVSSVQFSLNESSALAFRVVNSGRLLLLVPTPSTFFVWAMSEIFSSWITSWRELHQLSSSHLLRSWFIETTTATTSSTMTYTSTTATTSTTTRVIKQFPSPLLSSGGILGALELAFSDPLEVFSRAIASDLENSNVDGAYRETIDPLWADRGLEASTLLSSWCQEASLAPVRNLSRIFVALDPAALKIVDNSGLRPLHTLLQALDKGLPSWWNESYWGDSAGGPDWEIPVPTTSTATRTTTRTQDLESLLCPDVDCLPAGDCGVDPAELECIAWSESLLRFVPAMGCTLVAEPGRHWPLLQSGHFELVCECEGWALHSAMAIADKRPELTPFPPQVIITTREYEVSWYDKVNRYNLRGLAIVVVFIVLALLHLAIAACAEVRWRMQARWVAMHASRMKGVQVEVKTMDNIEKDFVKRRKEEIAAQGEMRAAVVAAEAEEALLQAQSLQTRPVTTTSLTTSLDFRQAKDGLATLFQAQGLGDVEDDIVRPVISQPGPSATPTVSTFIVTNSLKKEAPSIAAAVPPPTSSSGAPSQALREAAHEEAFQPEAMILIKQPLRERVVNYLHAAAVEASHRCTLQSVWHSCQMHHKIVCLSDDSQTWTFSAPERAAVFHFSLWINAVCLALVLGGGVDRRPYEDPFCPGAGHELTLATAGCLLQASQLREVIVAALWAVPMSSAVQTFCRGRNFAVRTQELTAGARERAFTRHFLGPWPSVLMASQEAQVRLWNLFCGVTAAICCCSCCPRLKRRPLIPLHWQPSLVPCCTVLLLLLLTWALCYYMFFFSSSIYMYEVSRTDTPELEIMYPPDERAEVAAAESQSPLQARLILVPEMQRFLVLLVLSWFMNYFIFEPMYLALHLLVGEPTLSDLICVVWEGFMVPVRWLSWLCGLCFPQRRRDQVWELWSTMTRPLQRCTHCTIPSLAMPTGKLCCCCRKRSQLASVAPEDLKETIESEDEDEGRTPKQVEVKQHKEESAKESQESGEDKEEKRKKQKRKKRKP